MKVVIEGEPVAKGRPRLSRYGTYTPAKTKNAEIALQMAWKMLTKDKIYYEDKPISLIVDFYKKPPKSTSKKRLKLMEDKIIRPTTRPDIDNYIKLVLDALNELAYKDDNLICDLRARKYYSINPRIEIEMEEIN
ncbi:RusA family crossover junction endodeoxyribonuclease [Miniphocaeibacter massiliensis]|uniref:RusA family crossover junction endodeoxyribonuclease n=1 Tax=Miniphocaeibacter massiliensis TaxID=2041841 RepID=UPI000C1BFD28|nr:RusA family crossover junction endodeoxyribonuclease [Miniphocaeibacter massiliensis]